MIEAKPAYCEFLVWLSTAANGCVNDAGKRRIQNGSQRSVSER